MPHEDTPPRTGTPEPLRESLATQSAVQEWEGTLKRQLSAVLAAVNAAAAAEHAVAGRARLPAVVRDLSRALDAALEQAVAAGRGGGAGAGGEPGADAHETHGVAVLAPLPLGAGRRCTATDQAAGEAPTTRPHKMPRADDGEARVQDAAIETCALLGLLGPAVAGLPDADKVALAATSSAMLWAVLDSSSAARWTAVGRDLGTRMGSKLFERVSGGSLGGCGKPARGLIGWTQPVQPGRNDPCPHWWAGSDVELASSIARLSGLLYPGGSFITPDMTGLRCIQLRTVNTGQLSTTGWLPPSVAARIEELSLYGPDISSIPEGMARLAVLDIEGCENLAVEFLPESSRRALRKLNAADSSLAQLPEGMSALEELDMQRCEWLHEDFLPASSAANVRILAAGKSDLRRVPEDMHRLEVLDIEGCENLAVEFLPESSRRALRKLNAADSWLEQLPEGMSALEELDVTLCDPRDDFLPASSAANVRVLKAEDSHLRSVPGHMHRLQDLDINGCGNLHENALPQSSALALVKLNALASNFSKLPEHMPALEVLVVPSCDLEEVPAGAVSRLRELTLSPLTLPSSMPALELIMVYDTDSGKANQQDDAVWAASSKVVSMPLLRAMDFEGDMYDMTERSDDAKWAHVILSRMIGRSVELTRDGRKWCTHDL